MSREFLPFTRPSIDEATIAGVGEVLRSGWITTGPQARAFEAALSEHCGGRPVRAYSSGTITMEIALRLAGVGAGDEVITTPLTWVSTANVILEVGARPVFVDVARVDLSVHLPVMGDFWETVLLRAGRYRGNALRPHVVLDAEVRLTAAHFARWLALWGATIDERHAGDTAELAKVQARRIAGSISRRLRGQPASELVTIRSQPPDPRPS